MCRAVILFLSLAVLLPAGSVYGDGGCGSKERPATAAEREFHLAAMEAMKAALPSVPEGWMVAGEHYPKSEIMACADGRPSGVEMSVQFKREDLQTRRAALHKKSTEAASPFDEKVKALLSRNTEAAEALGRAIKDNDKEGQKRLSVESKSLHREIKALQKEKDAAVKKAIEPHLLRDTEMRVHIKSETSEGSRLNWRNHTHSKFTVPGAAYAYRVNNEHRVETDRWEEGVTQILIGGWAEKSDVFYPQVTKIPEKTAIQAILVTISADEKRATEALKGMDIGKLKALIKLP